MTAYIDQLLTDRLAAAGESGKVEAIIVVKEGGDAPPAVDDGGLARRVIEAAAERTDVVPDTVRYFPRANAVVVSAGGRFIRELLNDERIAVASATDVDSLGFLIKEASSSASNLKSR